MHARGTFSIPRTTTTPRGPGTLAATVQFTTEEAFLDAVEARLATAGAQPSLARAIAETCAEAFKVVELPQPSAPSAAGTMRFLTGRTRWVIRDDDLKLLEALTTAATAAAGAAFFTGGPATPVTAAVTGLVTVILQLGRRVRKHAILLTPAQHLVAMALKTLGNGAALDDIVDRVNVLAEGQHPEARWTAEDTKAELEALQRLRKTNGDVIALVAVDHEGLWGLCDV